MAQSTEIAPGLRKFYRAYFSAPWLNKATHLVIDVFVDTLALMQGFSFPEKFNWEWKMEMLTKKYESETVKLFEKIITPGMHIVDIGAHIGYFSRMYSKLVGESGIVYCFEADPENYALLEKNTKGLVNVSLHKVAVSEKNGTIDFYHIDNSTGCHSIVSPDSPSKKITVDSVTLDSLIERGEVVDVDLIKIDIEGGEPFAFRGMEKLLRSSAKVKIVAEYNEASLVSGGTSGADFLKQIASYGFTIYFITKNGLVAQSAIPEDEQRSYFSRPGDVNLYCTKEPSLVNI